MWAELKNVNIFTQSKSFKLNFTQRKTRVNRDKLVPKLNTFDIKGFIWRKGAGNFIMWGWFYDKSSYKFPNFTHTTIQYSKTACSTTLFTPTFQYFYTDISAISVTFRNSDVVQYPVCTWPMTSVAAVCAFCVRQDDSFVDLSSPDHLWMLLTGALVTFCWRPSWTSHNGNRWVSDHSWWIFKRDIQTYWV